MASAQRLYRLYVVLAAAAGTALLLALIAVADAVTLSPPSFDAWLDACRRFLLPHLTALTVTILVVTAATGCVLVCGIRSFVRQLRASRRYVRRFDARKTVVAGRKAWVVGDPDPLAFCAGYLVPRIYVSSGAMAALAPDELHAVLAHEGHHARRRDPLRMLLARTVADALFFVPALRRLADRYAALAELAADEAALVQTGDRQPLASALLVFGESRRPAAVVGIAPERVDHLLGDPARWRVPPALVAASVAIVAALLAVALWAGASSATAVSLPMLVARSCMVLMAAFAALGVGSAAVGIRSFLAHR